ncbi:probable serine/threonine-protein kinase DDB_G0278845 [Chelonus insularis]|uniref:probable serine/threonine-protein kinase DDB_G0278845 n=1 Tax=Chelonus insularis TaxID=460826 RepID=UPI00158F4CB2|nr:probable serine/threonine-protein kinase DDB_G0278845 [Chelonus insularis]
MTDKRFQSERSNSTHEDLSSSSTSSFSSDDETDGQDLKPIKDYLYDRRELTKQLFMSVKMEKIRMMLPQVLKSINMNELQEWCASELSGMSKSRILSILDGKPMINSSDTSDSDDSGPSLEIISDTEEWITDSDQPADQKDKSGKSNKSKAKKNKKHSTNNPSQGKSSQVKESLRKNIDLTKIKNEKETKSTPNPQGESLLDLLELEMRARAIRALIRKEENLIPNAESSSSTSATTNNLNKQNIFQTNSKESNNEVLSDTSKVFNESQMFQNINSTLNEDEDVVLVIKPTPTIELLSSDSENENSESCTNKSNNKVEQSNVVMRQESELNKVESNKNILKQTLLDNEKINCDQVNEKNGKNKISCEKDKKLSETDTVNSDSKENKIINLSLQTENSNENDKITLSDCEEVIDLDDYSNDMDDIENDNTKDNLEKSDHLKESCSFQSTETWATRYYQTDNVQNVIKESKIQSEIRKRFRERQKLSKLGNSSKDLNKKSCTEEKSAELDEIKPTGSVTEYLALKNLSNLPSNDTISSANNKPTNTADLSEQVSVTSANNHEETKCDEQLPINLPEQNS